MFEGNHRRILALGAALLAIGSLSACGGSRENVAQVSGTPIAKATVEHWMAMMAGGRVTSQPSTSQYQALQRRALSFLISSQWTIGEAAELGVAATNREAQKQLELLAFDELERITYEGLPKKSELPALFASGHATSHSDRLWLMRIALLDARVEHKRLVDAEQQLPRAQILAYYDANRSRFVIPERRGIEWITTFDEQKLLKAVREIRSGKNFVSVAEHVSLDGPIFEGIELATESEKWFARTVFAAKPHVLSGPYFHYPNHWVLDVTKVTPARQQTLGESEATIRQQLAAPEVTTSLADALEKKWAAKTRCLAAYAVAKCGQAVNTLG